jgi:hypothetical protein
MERIFLMDVPMKVPGRMWSVDEKGSESLRGPQAPLSEGLWQNRTMPPHSWNDLTSVAGFTTTLYSD